jgi:uncharacterized membrane protein YdbT with pleckstrin-like domain
MSFLQLTDDETILKIYHRHWFAYVSDVISIIILLITPLILIIGYFILPEGARNTLATILGDQAAHVMVTLFAMWVMVVWIFAWIRWTMQYLNAIIITNERIYEIRQKGFFSRHILSFPLERIQDVTVETNGLLATMFGFGALTLETAGENHELDMHMMKDPEDIKLYINTAHDYKKEAMLQQLHSD